MPVVKTNVTYKTKKKIHKIIVLFFFLLSRSTSLSIDLLSFFIDSMPPLFGVVLMVEDGRRRSCRECCELEEPPLWELLVVGVTFKDGDCCARLLVLILD